MGRLPTKFTSINHNDAYSLFLQKTQTMKNIYTILFSFYAFCISAQTKIIQGTLKDFEVGSIVYLRSFTGSNITTIDSAEIDKNGKFVFTNATRPKFGLHQLVAGQYTVAFPMPKNDLKIELDASLESLKNGSIVLKNSSELLAYQELNALVKTIKEWRENYNNTVKQLNRFDRRFKALTDSLHLKNVAQLKQFNSQLDAFAKKYFGTYSAEILAPLYKSPAKEFLVATDSLYDTPAAYYHQHFFDFVNVKEEGTIYNAVIEEKILDYLKQYIAPSPEGVKEGMDIIIRKFSANNTVKEFVVSHLIELASQRSDMEIAEYLFKNYYSDGCESNLKPQTAALLENIKKLMPGKSAPDIELIDANSKRIKLSDVKGKKAVMVYFWSSGCGYCREATPKLKKLYDNYKAKGLEIFAVSLDQDYAAWTAYLEENKINWLNVTELKGWQTRALEAYSVTGTPTYFLLDGNLKIVSRHGSFDGIDKAVVELLD